MAPPRFTCKVSYRLDDGEDNLSHESLHEREMLTLKQQKKGLIGCEIFKKNVPDITFLIKQTSNRMQN